MSTTLKFWKLKDDGEIHPELVASLFQGKVEVYGRYKEHASVDEEGNLGIVNVSKDYEGVYRREIRNGGTFRELVVFKVLGMWLLKIEKYINNFQCKGIFMYCLQTDCFSRAKLSFI